MINQDVSAKLWQQLSLQVRNVVPLVEAPKGVVQMLGFADLIVYVADIPFICLPKVALKIIRGRLHFDPQCIEGKGQKVGEYFPTWRPSTAEARVVIEELLKTVPDIQQLVEMAGAKNTKESSNA